MSAELGWNRTGSATFLFVTGLCFGTYQSSYRYSHEKSVNRIERLKEIPFPMNQNPLESHHSYQSLKASIASIIHLIGSIASITGISLLWLRGTIEISPVDVVWFALVVSFFLGLTAAVVSVDLNIFDKWFRHRAALVKVAFIGLTIPLSASIIGAIGVSVVILAKAALTSFRP